MTPEKFVEYASVEKAMSDQLKATGQAVTPETLHGCVMAVVQIAQHLKVSEADVLKQVAAQFAEWTQYVETKKRIAANRAAKGAKR